MWKLETFTILNVLDNFVSKVAGTVATAEKMGIEVGGLTKLSERLGLKRTIFPTFGSSTFKDPIRGALRTNQQKP